MGERAQVVGEPRGAWVAGEGESRQHSKATGDRLLMATSV